MNSNHRFTPGVVPPPERTEKALWFAFQGNRLLVSMESSSAAIPRLARIEELGPGARHQNFLGRFDGHPVYAAELPEGISPPTGMSFEGLRSLYGHLEEDLFWLAGRAVQIVDWDRTHQFCGRCAVPLKALPAERAKECPRCGLLHFPRLAPAIIVLVERGEEMLLARSHRFPYVMYSTLAGFVEPGETLEEAVLREVNEETGIRIKDIRYFGSQPWPFPHSLMIGFTAVYESGEINIDEKEIMDARWFTVDNLPPLPGKISIARKLIDSFLAKHGKLQEG